MIDLGTEQWFIIVLISFALFVRWILPSKRKRKRRIKLLAKRAQELTPTDFFELRNFPGKKGKRRCSSEHNFAGVYILYNKTKKMYYVGQAQRVLDRVNSHFTGKGNGDVYADYKYGDEFTIRMIGLANSGFRSLNALERYAIDAFKAYPNGYNRKKGNR